MSGDIAKVVTMLVTVNVVALVVLIALSFAGSVLALEGLEKLDLWMRRRDEKMPSTPAGGRE
jgi:hypothetical protein